MRGRADSLHCNRNRVPDVRIYPDPQQTAEACAAQILEWLREAIALRGVASLAISGGTSPRAMFRCFALASLPWEKVHLFWVDERCVPPDDPESNFKLANDTWLASAPVQPVIHRIVGELSPALAAERYTADIRSIFATASSEIGSDTEIRFDVVHRGMGADSHTASLFPGSPLLGRSNGVADATWVEKFHQWRVTLLPGILEQARHTAMLVTGEDKAPALDAVLHGPVDLAVHPAQIAVNTAVWFCDAEAARAR